MAYLQATPARIHGYERRFWQGSHDHRGTPDEPGRVVTLIANEGAVCDGMAYLLDENTVAEIFEKLDYREKNGYERIQVTMQLATFQQNPGRDVDGLAYIATHENPAFLGAAPLEDIAQQINECVGPSGKNADYLFELAAALRALDVCDPHVFELESLVNSMAA